MVVLLIQHNTVNDFYQTIASEIQKTIGDITLQKNSQ